ncbi:MAG: His-Xaa-Ser system radical SAM maturase HxsB [bacterium]|nr:His-Xaa-Ser system radical SAM maturase HxsB [bacterium]
MTNNNFYIILPFNFIRFRHDLVLMVNMVGEHFFLQEADFKNMVGHELNRKSDVYLRLKAKHFVTETISDPAIDLLAIKFRTKNDFLSHFTSLHMLEVTRRCNQKCVYCQASSLDPDKSGYDMSTEIAQKAVDMILMSPAKHIKIEFQGGEPLLNFETVKYVIDYVTKQATSREKKIEFVVCTNLTIATDEMLKYFAENNVLVSTSLDGPRDVHNSCRMYRDGTDTYDDVTRSLDKARKYLGSSKISALMTTSRYNLPYPKEIIEEYIRNGFSSIFLRPLNPFGYAKQRMREIGCGPSDFVAFFKAVLECVIDANLKGNYIEESFTSLLLTRILTPFSTGFVDLQFPAGTGISGAMYGYDGNVFLSDESRMLANTGDFSFCLGNVNKHSYRDIFYNGKIIDIIGSSCAELLPGCSDCAFQVYCGIDPVRNYATQNDPTGHRPSNEMCLINKGIFKHLFEIILEHDPNRMDVFWSWMTGRSLSEIRTNDRC